jgi:PiT family inorganic phosphate transporter
MTATFAFVLLLVALALIFDYINGFHDAANSIATVVSTRVLSPGVAVIWAAFFNFIAFAVFGTRVAKAIGDGVRMDLIQASLESRTAETQTAEEERRSRRAIVRKCEREPP